MRTRNDAAIGCTGRDSTLASELELGLEPLSGKSDFAAGKRQALKTALLLGATSMLAYPASAQEATAPEPVPLPPLNVEAAAQKKAPAKKGAAKKAAQTKQVSPAPQAPQAQAPQQQVDPLPGQAAPPAPGSFKADYASSAKMTAPLLDTPQTVTVITGTIIEERRTTNLSEVLRNTPGITFDAGENGFGTSASNFKLRGFDGSGNIFIDGARDNGSYARDMFNVDRVEVIKGAAADNGRGGAGGYINLVTKTPLLEDFVHFEAAVGFDEYGTDPRVRSTVDVNQRIGSVAVRMNGMVEDGGVFGRDIAEVNAYGVAPSIAFGLGTETRAILSYERVERQDLPDWGIFGRSIPGTVLYPYHPGAGNVSRDTFYGLRTDFDDATSDAVMARFEHDLSSSVTISNQTRWSQVDRQSRFTIANPVDAQDTTPSASVRTSTLFYDRVNETLSNQTNVTARFATGLWKHTASVGVDVSREESWSGRYAGINTTTDLFNPNPDRATPAWPAAPGNTADVTVKTVGVYAYDTIELNKQWELTGGLRGEYYTVDIADTRAGGLDGYDDSEFTLGGKVGVVYKPVEEGSVYASFGVSHLPPGSYLSNPDISRDDANTFPGFIRGADPVQILNYEIGTKWDFFGGKLTTTAALFHTEKRTPIGPTGTLIGYGDQIAQGLELGIAGEVTEQWKVFGGLLLLNTERRHSAAIDAALRAANPGDFTGVDGTIYTGANGDKLAFTPDVSATLWTTYDVTKAFTIGGGVQYVGESWLGRPDDALRIIPNGAKGKLPDYFLVNLMASYDVTDNVELRLNVDNVFDETYAQSMNWAGRRATLGAPRTYWLSTSVKY